MAITLGQETGRLTTGNGLRRAKFWPPFPAVPEFFPIFYDFRGDEFSCSSNPLLRVASTEH